MKVAISVPDPLFEAAEKLARTRSIPRSKLYAEALSFYVSSHRAEDVTAQLNQVYGGTESCLETEFVSAQSEALGNESW